MKVADLIRNEQHLPVLQQRSADIAAKVQQPDGEKFSDSLNKFIHGVNSLQLDSAKEAERFIKGEPVDIHDVMIAAEKAKTTFSLLLELRNKALDMYREVIRIQV